MTLTIASPAFGDGETIPAKYTCDGANVSPPLKWNGVPEGAQSLVLIVEDPDAPDPKAPQRIWNHWILYNLPADTRGLGEAVSDAELPASTLQGLNDWKRTGYGGACPPIGRHRYFHTLYALDRMLPDLKRPSRTKLDKAMQGHILAQAELIGTYKRGR